MSTALRARLLALGLGLGLGLGLAVRPLLRVASIASIASIASVASIAAMTACHHDAARETLPGVRLGMSPRDVRDRFEGGAEGSWTTKVGGGAGASDDTVVEWSSTTERSRITHARFEFHLGMLVAIRAHLREVATGADPRIEATPKTVTVVSAGAGGGGGTDVTVLARDCPTHRDEAESLVAKAR